MNIDGLPLEAFIEILLRTDGVTLGHCQKVSKKWKEVIDGTDLLWQEACKKEFKYTSRLAKKKAGGECTWRHIYKNLKTWSKVSSFQRDIREFYKFSLHDKNHALEINNNILPLRDTNGVVLYDLSTLKYIPVTIPDKKCSKIANNDYASIIMLKTDLFVQRTVDVATYMTEISFKADDFVLYGDTLFFYNNRDVYKCDLLFKTLSAHLLIHCDYDIKEILYDNGVLHIFTDCGRIVSITKDGKVSVQPINCPPEWIKQIKHVSALNDKNFVCYSRNLFKIETDNYKHLYLDFPPITALFFYGDITLIGTRDGEILLYRLADQKRAVKPKFEVLANLPDGKFAVQLDVCERKTGPVIVASTFFEIMLLEINFFPHGSQVVIPDQQVADVQALDEAERPAAASIANSFKQFKPEEEKEVKSSYSFSKLLLYKRVLKRGRPQHRYQITLEKRVKSSYPTNQLLMHNLLLKLRDRLQHHRK